MVAQNVNNVVETWALGQAYHGCNNLGQNGNENYLSHSDAAAASAAALSLKSLGSIIQYTRKPPAIDQRIAAAISAWPTSRATI